METVFRENRLLGENLPENAAELGRRLGSVFGRVSVGRDSERRYPSAALASGLISAGADIISLGECSEPELFYAAEQADCLISIYCREDVLLKLDIRSKGGIYLGSRERELLQSALSEEKELSSHEGKISDGKIFCGLYRRKLSEVFPKKPNYSVTLTRSGQSEKRMLSHINGAPELIVSLSTDGTKASMYSRSSGFVSMEELTLICCLDRFEKGEDAALPFSFPHAVNAFAEGMGRKILRYYASPDSSSDSDARELALRQRFTLDGMYLAAEALSYLAENNISIEDARKRIPKFYTSKRFVELEGERTRRLFQKFSSRVTPDGAAFAKNSSRIIMQPSAAGRGVWLTADSFSMEAASELCSALEEKLKNGRI